jgi:hypothetical protein
MSRDGRFADGRFAPAPAAVLLSFLLFSAFTLTDAAAGEEPKAAGYPAVEDVPPRPEKPAMTADEQAKLKNELNAARDRQPKAKSASH